MKQMFVRIKETVAEKLRGLCAGLLRKENVDSHRAGCPVCSEISI